MRRIVEQRGIADVSGRFSVAQGRAAWKVRQHPRLYGRNRLGTVAFFAWRPTTTEEEMRIIEDVITSLLQRWNVLTLRHKNGEKP